jgi:hypothetical protein
LRYTPQVGENFPPAQNHRILGQLPVKPSLLGTEFVDILNYHKANNAFPIRARLTSGSMKHSSKVTDLSAIMSAKAYFPGGPLQA